MWVRDIGLFMFVPFFMLRLTPMFMDLDMAFFILWGGGKCWCCDGDDEGDHAAIADNQNNDYEGKQENVGATAVTVGDMDGGCAGGCAGRCGHGQEGPQ